MNIEYFDIRLSQFPSKELLNEQLEIVCNNNRAKYVKELVIYLSQSDDAEIIQSLFPHLLNQLVDKASKLVALEELIFHGDFLMYDSHATIIQQIVQQLLLLQIINPPKFRSIRFTRVALSTRVIDRFLSSFQQQQHDDNVNELKHNVENDTAFQVNFNLCGWFLETSTNNHSNNIGGLLHDAPSTSLPVTFQYLVQPGHSSINNDKTNTTMFITMYKMSIDLATAQRFTQDWQELVNHTTNLPKCETLICTNSTITTDAIEYLLSSSLQQQKQQQQHFNDVTTIPFLIRDLSLKEMKLKDEHAQALAKSLQSNTTLINLSIQEKKGVSGLRHYVNVLKTHNVTLKRFTIGHFHAHHNARLKLQIEFYTRLNKMGRQEILLQSNNISPLLLPIIISKKSNHDPNQCFWILKTLPHLLFG